MSDSRADALIAELRLRPHPEGGWYRRLFASALPVTRALDGATRPAVTSIVYLLKAAEVSRWHRVTSDEIWSFYEGAPLELLCADAELTSIEALALGPVAANRLPLRVIPATHWQAARPVTGTEHDYSLVGCAVAPGFDFADFTLMSDDAVTSAALRARHPRFTPLL